MSEQHQPGHRRTSGLGWAHRKRVLRAMPHLAAAFARGVTTPGRHAARKAARTEASR